MIFNKIEGKEPKNASLLELINNIVVTSDINIVDIRDYLNYICILGMNTKYDPKVCKK